ncbi:hypothetical protein RHMOL_Rhmol08G0210800 [Rhododendron molle]|uniref:Uncharacterized protein n=1 Tax=Rhododendron molle TaxID=49168 RepID=A0ACC0MQP9_RHOML|nr:hypothetical protein RHMOL_Rhmol08G0210800 [Rhododendron molle]
MKEKDVDLPFSSYLQFHKPSKKTDKTELKVITKSKWEKSNKTVVSHPPLESSIIDYKGSSITASPLKLPTDKSDCKQIVEQVNYTNQCLKTISKRLETKLEDGIASCVLSPSKELEKPLINLPDCRSPVSLDNCQDDLKIENLLNKLTVKPEPSTPQLAVVTYRESSSQMTSSSDEIIKLQKQFTDQPKVQRLTTGPVSHTRNWYSRPTPVDIQYEENNLLNQFSVSSTKLYEWNIDGLSEHQILEKLNHMSMVASSYLTNTNLNQPQNVELLASAFTSILKAWWDKYLDHDSRKHITHAVQTDENKHGIHDGVNTLIHTIIKHFINKPTGIIEYDKLTYGDIVSTIQKEGLSMYIDMKINAKNNKKAKYELGNFCEQYGLPPVAPSRKKIKTEKITCFNCGKKRHYKSQCKIKQKISQLKISDSDKKQILAISSSDDSGDNVVITSDYHSPSSTDNPVKIGCTDTCCKEVNVLTQELPEEDLLIDDVASKQHYTKKLGQLFKTINIEYNQKIVEITPLTLLDHGLLRQLIFTDPEQTDIFTRKLAVSILNLFAKYGCLKAQVLIKSKLPEWTWIGNIIPAQHVMQISAQWPFSRIHLPIQLIEDEIPYPCSKPIRSQIRHHRAWSIATNLGENNHNTDHYLDNLNYLICEDHLQKIRSTEPIHEVPFIFHTQLTNLVTQYEEQLAKPCSSSSSSDDDYCPTPEAEECYNNWSSTKLLNLNNLLKD